ncbi:hypothetical protein YYE_04901 [Plasmodium vinckei vinckei]|uniref:PYST-C1-like N-terminal domain-containing protein n=1 Tax=Plasmodium vinckei vinckei TaxID=54757 RepID=A0A081I9N2_PLAVN|nr:hypothetical protein YYE_04901 [Plasmodium vinckei vinckei]
MNKRIFSLVCIILYVILAVLIHCSEQKHDQSKTSGLRSRIIRAINKLDEINKKNDLEPQLEAILKNNYIRDYLDDINNKDYRDVSYYSEYLDDEDTCNREDANNDDVDDDKESKRRKDPSFNKMIENFLNDNKDLSMDRLEIEKYVLNILKTSPNNQTVY